METELDTKGLVCPLPVLKARKALKALAAGDRLRVEATDPSSVADFAVFCETMGHALVDSAEDGGVFVFVIEKGA